MWWTVRLRHVRRKAGPYWPGPIFTGGNASTGHDGYDRYPSGGYSCYSDARIGGDGYPTDSGHASSASADYNDANGSHAIADHADQGGPPPAAEQGSAFRGVHGLPVAAAPLWLCRSGLMK